MENSQVESVEENEGNIQKLRRSKRNKKVTIHRYIDYIENEMVAKPPRTVTEDDLIDDQECDVCGNVGMLVICDGCGKGYHGRCHIPQIDSVPGKEIGLVKNVNT
ncbi:hypothetical protein D3C80_1962360 [compost metagenome]